MRVILNGACGRMGKAVIEAVSDTELEIVCGIDCRTDCGDFGIPMCSSLSEVDFEADVLIDFSHHSAINDIAAFVRRTGMPCVIATTGHTESEKAVLLALASDYPVFYSRNMSLGINLLIGLCVDAVKRLGGDCDIEIIEKHHRNKLDAPSGTALMIAESISDAMPDYCGTVCDRTARSMVRPKGEIGISSVRCGGIFGEHEVLISRGGETVSIKHTAESRTLFAEGAVSAARFIASCAPGLYTMQELLSSVAEVN